MELSTLIVFMALVLVAVFMLGRGRSLSLAQQLGHGERMSALPFYYGLLTMIWSGLPALFLLGIWAIFRDNIFDAIIIQSMPDEMRQLNANEMELVLNKVYHVAYGQTNADAPGFIYESSNLLLRLEKDSEWLMSVLVLLTMVLAAALVYLKIQPRMQARYWVEMVFKTLLFGCSFIAIFTTVGIVFSLLFESIRFFQMVPISEFLFGLEWSPQSAIRVDQVADISQFGAIPLFAGTLMIALIAMTIAIPLGLMSAIYLSEYAPRRVRSVVKPLLEILAGVPTIVYGFVAALSVAPLIRELAMMMGAHHYLTVSSESALAAGLVMGVMIMPFISSLSDDVIHAVPKSLRDGALSLGSTNSEVVKRVVIPAALPGIVGGILLALSRAIGETMIVVMAAGLVAKLTANPLDSMTTVTVQIVTLLVGDQEFDSPKTLAAFALGLLLFCMTLALNIVSLKLVRRYREVYE